MYEIKVIFNDKCTEISEYISFLKSVDISRAVIAPILSHPKTTEIGGTLYLEITNQPSLLLIDDNIKKILKANVYLLLYNLVESTVRDAVGGIYSHLGDKSILFDDLRIDLKKAVLKNFYKHLSNGNLEIHSNKVDEFCELDEALSLNVVHKTFDKMGIFSGNVDAKKIRHIASGLGFSINADATTTRDGADLVNIKEKRNDLAHGHVTFCECGKDLTVNELSDILDRTTKYLTALLDGISDYLSNEHYLHRA